MWVIPKNLNTSPSVQGTEELILDSKELSDLSEQSLLWRSSHSQSATWSQRWKKGLLRQRPVWTNLKTLDWKIFRGKVDVISGGFPCQPFSAAGRRQADSDPRHLFPHILRGLKICQPPVVFLENVEGILSAKLSSEGWSDPKAHRFCSMYLESWRGWVMRRRQEYSQREKSVLHIEGNESSYLVLKEVPKEKAWSGSMDSLTETETQVALYTPPQEEESNTLGNPQEQTQENYKLNPRWVETLMGLPIGWVMPSCTSPLTIERMSSECLETELSQILQGEPSPTYGENWSTPQLHREVRTYVITYQE